MGATGIREEGGVSGLCVSSLCVRDYVYVPVLGQCITDEQESLCVLFAEVQPSLEWRGGSQV